MALQIIRKQIPIKRKPTRNSRKVPIVIDMTDDNMAGKVPMTKPDLPDVPYQSYPLLRLISNSHDNVSRTVEALPVEKHRETYVYVRTKSQPTFRIGSNSLHNKDNSTVEIFDEDNGDISDLETVVRSGRGQANIVQCTSKKRPGEGSKQSSVSSPTGIVDDDAPSMISSMTGNSMLQMGLCYRI